MPRRPSTAHKTSLYRLVAPADGSLRACIQEKYLEADFQASDVTIGDIAALLAYGVIPNLSPKWLPHIESLVNRKPEVYNYTSAAVLLVPLRGYVYALSWGFGHLIIAPEQIDSGFGLRFAIRRANPADAQVRSLTTHTMDTLARTARTTVPGGAALDAFGMEEIGEVVSRLVGRIPATGLSGAGVGESNHLTIRGADGLGIQLGRQPAGLLADLQLIHDVVENEGPIAGLEHFEHTKPLRGGHPLIKALESELAEALISLPTARIALSWPAEWEDEHGEASRYHIQGLSRSDWEDEPDDIELDHLLGPTGERPPEQRVPFLKRLKVIGLDSDGNPMSRAIAGDRWITFETDLDGQRYVFYQGRWFNIGGAYLDMLRTKVARILDRKSGLSLPRWPLEQKHKGRLGPVHEDSYNLMVAASVVSRK
jgi:uncharacterized protein (TIGR04141 family)